MTLDGRRDDFTIDTRSRPLDLQLDPYGEILAWFISADHDPKRYMQYQAEDLFRSGDLARAESRFRAALELSREDTSTSRRVQDIKIRLSLVRLHVEQGRDDEALEGLDRVDDELEEWNPMLFRMQRDALRSRIEIRHGEYGFAYKRLKKTLRIASPRNAHTYWRDIQWQRRLNSERAAVTEAYSLLAISAHETGNREVFKWARREARNRGVDVSALPI